MPALDPVPRVISISMGNPGNSGLFQLPFSLLGVSPGFNSETRKLFDDVYDAGVIVVAAAGHVISSVVYPARYGRTIAVGGYSHNKIDHYPPDDYDIPGRVDICAQADGINRAYAKRRANGTIDRGHAEGEGADPTDISGTSYATPQVAAAAALWVNTHFHELPAIGDADAWKGVEAFRDALVASADIRGLKVGRPSPVTVNRPCLNIERLVGMAPDLAAVVKKAPAAKFWGNQL